MKQDPRNYRKHSERNKELIRKSLAQFGAGRSVLVDGDDYIVAGNGVMEQAEALGIPTRVIETDGTELVVVKRTDLTLNDPRRKELALADNATSDSSAWDVDALAEDWSGDQLGEWDVDVEEWHNLNGEDMSDSFNLQGGDREPFQQMTFSLADEQAEKIKEAIAEIKKTDEFKHAETFGNENGNGNALYLLVAKSNGHR